VQEELRLKQEDAKEVRLKKKEQCKELQQAHQEEVRLKEEEAAAKKYDNKWESAIELAQQGLKGTVVGLEVAIINDGAKATWVAGMLAQELQQGPGDDRFEDEEGDLDPGWMV
jgi:pyruvate formate-lyase activating enzyme-like uncharacterized protein